MSILLAGKVNYYILGSPTPQKMHGDGSDDKENFYQNYNRKRLKAELDKIELNRETFYMIDKVVRQRVSKVMVSDSFGRELLENNNIIQRMVEGASSNSKINKTREDINKEEELSSEGAERRINSV